MKKDRIKTLAILFFFIAMTGMAMAVHEDLIKPGPAASPPGPSLVSAKSGIVSVSANLVQDKVLHGSDGLVNVAAPSQRLWERMCTALEADDLLENPDYQKGRDRAARNAELTKALNALFSGFSTAELVEKLNAAGVPCGPVNNIGEAFEDEQVKYLKMAKPAPHSELGAVNPSVTEIDVGSRRRKSTHDSETTAARSIVS